MTDGRGSRGKGYLLGYLFVIVRTQSPPKFGVSLLEDLG